MKREGPSIGRLWAFLACCVALGGTAAAEVSNPDRPPLPSLAASAPAPVATVWLAGPEGSALTVEQALLKAKDGDTIDLLPGEYRGGLLIENRRLVFRGVAGGKPVLIKGDGKAGPLKALWTIRGGQVTLQNLEFRGAKSAEGSGAAVRQEGGQLLVQGCQFYDNEHGLLSINDPQAQLTIESSVFGMAPKAVGGLHHLLNVGRIPKLSVTGSRFQQGFEGHLIKTRARENFIAYNFIHDGQRGGASYEIDIAHGGLATVLGNVIGQGAETQNPVMVGYATEDQSWDKNELLLAHNTFVSYGWLPAWYLRVIKAHLPGEPQVIAINNLLVGGGAFSMAAPGHFDGNRHATRGMLTDADTYAFELPAGSMWRSSGVDPRKVKGHDLSPKGEFQWPVGVSPLPKGATRWAPGAYQK